MKDFLKTAYLQLDALRKTLHLIHGSYALALIDKEAADTIYVAKNKSPLTCRCWRRLQCRASDAMAMLQVTEQYVELHDQEIVIVHKDSVEIQTLDGTIVERASL